MKKILIAVGSTRKPKLTAVQEAVAAFSDRLAPAAQFEIVAVEVESGVSHTPLTREECMQGARQRADVLIDLHQREPAGWRYFVGLEGGLDVLYEGATPDEVLRHSAMKSVAHRRVFLESWAYVSDGVSGHFGCSGAIAVPNALAHDVLQNGMELSAAIDKFAGAVGIRDAQGAWGVLSSNLISRQEAFRIAIVAAFAPFYNVRMYTAAAAAG